MQFSRSQKISPVIVSAIFTLLLSGCGNSDTAMPTPSDASSSAMSESDASSVPTSSSAAMLSSQAAVVPKQKYGDGTFAAVGGYRSPAGAEEVNVSLTLKNGVVTAAAFQGTATNPKSVKMQAAFAAGFQEAVIGKSIDGLNLDVVNGSSLTPMGFMDALSKIKAEAAA